jgi:hypothetical protein
MKSNRPEQPAARPQHLAAWKLPPIVAGISLPIVGGFYVGGPGLGMAIGALAAAAIIVLAVRKPPLQPIVPAGAADQRRRILVVLSGPLDETALAEFILDHIEPGFAGAASGFTGPAPEIVLVAPCRQRFLERWTSDLGPGRERAQRDLVHAVAALAGSGVEATARLGDEDVVQTVEDVLRSFAAGEVVLAGDTADGEDREAAARALEERLRVPLYLARLSSPGSASSSCARTDGRRPSSPASYKRRRGRRRDGLPARG